MIGHRSCALNKAEYYESRVPHYQNHPYILALGPQCSDEDAFDVMARLPPYDPECRTLPAVDRYQYLPLLRSLVVPTEDTIRGYRKLSVMVRHGLLDRNPMMGGIQQKLKALDELAEDLREADFSRMPYNNAMSGLLTGISGTGKTTLTRCFLDSLPQGVLIHDTFNGKKLNSIQVISLVMENCFDGSSKGMLSWGLKELGRLVGENFMGNLPNNYTAYDLMAEFVKQLLNYNVGMVVIDEAEFIRAQYSEGNAKEVFCWINLMNCSGVPLFLIANPEIEDVLEPWLKVASRFSAGCRMRIHPLERGEEYDGVLESIWDYQYTKTNTPLTETLRSEMYYYSQGIHRLTQDLYRWTQELTISRGGNEIITPRLIQEAAELNSHDVQKAMAAIRENTQRSLRGFKDLGRKPIPRKRAKSAPINFPKQPEVPAAPSAASDSGTDNKSTTPRFKLGKKKPTSLVSFFDPNVRGDFTENGAMEQYGILWDYTRYWIK